MRRERGTRTEKLAVGTTVDGEALTVEVWRDLTRPKHRPLAWVVVKVGRNTVDRVTYAGGKRVQALRRDLDAARGLNDLPATA